MNLRKKWEDAMSKPLQECDCLCETHFNEEDIELYFETKMPDGTISRILKERISLKQNAIPKKV